MWEEDRSSVSHLLQLDARSRAEGLHSPSSHLNKPRSRGCTGFSALTVQSVYEAVLYPSRKCNTNSLGFFSVGPCNFLHSPGRQCCWHPWLTRPKRGTSVWKPMFEFLWLKVCYLKSSMGTSSACKYTRQDGEKYDPKLMFKFRLIFPQALFPLVLIQECIDRKLSFQSVTILNLVPVLIKQEKIRQCNRFGEQTVEGESWVISLRTLGGNNSVHKQ